MKFFTREWHEAWQFAKSEEERDKLREKTRQIIEEYEKQFRVVKPRLFSGFIDFYDSHGRFHDAEVKNIRVSRNQGKTAPVADVFIDLDIDEGLYQLHYGSVSKISYTADLLSSDIDIMRWREQFDIWMYDEFSVGSSNNIQHEVSFLSGGSLIIEFENINIKELHGNKGSDNYGYDFN
ncbi:MAG: hypothetical protein LBL34_04395 [Clostridiales bacterium]|jgi:hypothetical protein|nr:hypothetical protein [Clostridiales bacterium]